MRVMVVTTTYNTFLSAHQIQKLSNIFSKCILKDSNDRVFFYKNFWISKRCCPLSNVGFSICQIFKSSNLGFIFNCEFCYQRVFWQPVAGYAEKTQQLPQFNENIFPCIILLQYMIQLNKLSFRTFLSPSVISVSLVLIVIQFSKCFDTLKDLFSVSVIKEKIRSKAAFLVSKFSLVSLPYKNRSIILCHHTHSADHTLGNEGLWFQADHTLEIYGPVYDTPYSIKNQS